MNPTRVIVVAASPRTGSWLLCAALSATGQAGSPREYLVEYLAPENWPTRSSDHLGRAPLTLRGYLGWLRRRFRGDTQLVRSLERLSRRGMRALLEAMAAQYTPPNRVFAIKLHWHEYELMLRKGCDAYVWRAPISWVWVRRQDKLAQAISWSKALQSQQWQSRSPGDDDLRYDADQIERCLEEARRCEAGWEQYFAAAGIVPMTVAYEDLDTDYETAVATVWEYLGLEGVAVPHPSLRRQRDHVNAQWAERFVAERGYPGE